MVNTRWSVVGQSVRGAAHYKNGKPCQDAISVLCDADGRFCVACLADGHGSAQCPYSDEGAQIAVETVRDILVGILAEHSLSEAYRTFDAHKEIWLPKQIETQWKASVRKLHAKKERPDAEPFPYLWYGTTMLALAATAQFVFAVQIGDGDILTIDRDAAYWLISPEDTHGSETFSLCQPHCWQYFRSRLLPMPEAQDMIPPMFLLATDGYANSFSEPEGFMKAGTDIFTLWRDNGAAFIDTHLADWLIHSSAGGSGDDISMALVFLADEC